MNGIGIQLMPLHWGQVSIQPKVSINPKIIGRGNVGTKKNPPRPGSIVGSGRRC